MIANEILKNNIKNYKEYVKEINYEKEKEKHDFKIILDKKFCHYIPCFNKIIGSKNYCHLHNENTI